MVNSAYTWHIYFSWITHPNYICRDKKSCYMYMKYVTTLETIKEFINKHLDGENGWCGEFPLTLRDESGMGTKITEIIKERYGACRYKLVSIDPCNQIEIACGFTKKGKKMVTLNYQKCMELADVVEKMDDDYPPMNIYIRYPFAEKYSFEYINPKEIHDQFWFSSIAVTTDGESVRWIAHWSYLLEDEEKLLRILFPNLMCFGRKEYAKTLWKKCYSECQAKLELDRKNHTKRRINQTILKKRNRLQDESYEQDSEKRMMKTISFADHEKYMKKRAKLRDMFKSQELNGDDVEIDF